MGWLGTGDIAITVFDIGDGSGSARRYRRTQAGTEQSHRWKSNTVEMVIEQLGRKPRTSFGSEDCNLNQIARDYTMQITLCVKSSG